MSYYLYISYCSCKGSRPPLVHHCFPWTALSIPSKLTKYHNEHRDSQSVTLIWLIALIGIFSRLIFFDSIPYAVGSAIFVAMGWVGIFSGALIHFQYGPGHLGPLFAGGICYTAGAVIDANKWPILIPAIVGPHELFHLMVLAGLGFQWYFIAQIANGRTPQPE